MAATFKRSFLRRGLRRSTSVVGSTLKFIIRPPNAPPYVVTLERLTRLLILAQENYRMGLFEEKMKQAKDARAKVRENALADFDKVLQRAAEVDAKREQATTAHLVGLDSDAAAFDSMAAALDEYSNGAEEPPIVKQTAMPANAWTPPHKD